MKMLLLSVLLCLPTLLFTQPVLCGQGQTAVQPAAGASQEGQSITVRGKIEFMEQLGGYYVNGEDPAGEFMITNQNSDVLGKLLKSGKTVTIEGRLPMGAELLFIETIDGKQYCDCEEKTGK
jgi:hypothetical protein